MSTILKQNIFKRPSASRIPPKNPRLPRFLLLGTQARTLHRNVAKFIFIFKNSPPFSHPLASASTYPFWGRVGMNTGNLVAKCWNWVLKIEPLSFRSTLSKKDSKEATKKGLTVGPIPGTLRRHFDVLFMVLLQTYQFLMTDTGGSAVWSWSPREQQKKRDSRVKWSSLNGFIYGPGGEHQHSGYWARVERNKKKTKKWPLIIVRTWKCALFDGVENSRICGRKSGQNLIK